MEMPRQTSYLTRSEVMPLLERNLQKENSELSKTVSLNLLIDYIWSLSFL